MQLMKIATLLISILIPTALNAASSDGPPFDWSDRRVTFVYLKTAFYKLDATLPTLSPAEHAWLESERAAMNSDTQDVNPGVPFTMSPRSEKYLASQEYKLFRIRDAVAEIKKALKAIEWAQSEGEGSAEVYYWIGLMRELDDGDDLAADLSALRSHGSLAIPAESGILWVGDREPRAARVQWRFWGAAIWGGFLEKATLQLAKDADRD